MGLDQEPEIIKTVVFVVDRRRARFYETKFCPPPSYLNPPADRVGVHQER